MQRDASLLSNVELQCPLKAVKRVPVVVERDERVVANLAVSAGDALLVSAGDATRTCTYMYQYM